MSYVGYVLADAQIYQAYESWRLEHSARRDTRALPAGLVIGKVQIPRLGLSAVVVQGDNQEILRRAVGHIPGTALPGQSGNIVLAGHRDSFFRALRKVHRGDRVVLETPAASYDYEVESTTVVAPSDVSVLQDSKQRQLTLITCYPFFWIGSASLPAIEASISGFRSGGPSQCSLYWRCPPCLLVLFPSSGHHEDAEDQNEQRDCFETSAHKFPFGLSSGWKNPS